jgi:hypothetical protein
VRLVMSARAGLFEWHNALRVLKPETLIRWHRLR